jgi:uncharacterized protein (TIGR03000 family)
MYSVILTAMMSTGAATPEFGGLFNRGCYGGCTGCSGGCSGCYGCSGCSGCYGCSGCGGCCGGGFLGWGLFNSRHSGCYGCSGCFGSCSGCFGGCSGCHGGCIGGYTIPIDCTCGNPADPVTFGMPGPSMPSMPSEGLGETSMPNGSAPPQTTLPPAELGEAVSSPNQATIVVTLPADARLFAEGQLIDLPGAVRTFRTPPLLEPGRTYEYLLKIEVQRNGQTVRMEETVKLESGKGTRVIFPEPGAGSGNTARIDVRFPADATLIVEGQPWNSTAGHAVIRTPELSAGHDHFYQLKVEIVRQSMRHTLTREVAFRAGQDLRVDFEEPAAARVAQR